MATSDSSLQSDIALPPSPVSPPARKGPPPLPPTKRKRDVAEPAARSSATTSNTDAVEPAPPSPEHRKKPSPARPARSAAEGSSKPPRPAREDRVATSAAKPDRREKRTVEAEDDEQEPLPRHGVAVWVQNSASMLFSMVVHLAVLLVLGIWMLPEVQKELVAELTVISSTDEPLEEELTAELETPLEETSEVVTSAMNAVVNGTSAAVASVTNAPSLDQSVAEQVQGINVTLEGPPIKTPGATSLISALPPGQVGETRAIVDNYDEALDRITQEILMMLQESKVLVVWCFDESESMKDDQQEIRDRIDHVYTQLGLKDAAQGDALHTSICSYGEKFTVRTAQPTSKLAEIKDAIDSITIDASGLEHMCSAVGQAINFHTDLAKSQRRRMALILVTDESGEHDDNNLYTEQMVQVAKNARCRVYTLGREAVFGYPYAHISWRHPQTGHVHWLPINRGPETGFPEQLQTEGFRRRYDSHNSGFGPYEQVRLAQQTGGIFFMLPSLEAKLVRGEKRRYELEAMRAYQPDMRSREELFQEAKASRFRSTILKIIYDLNPYRPEIAKAMEVRFEFSAKPEQFVKQVAQEQEKAKQYVLYLDAAAKTLEDLQNERKHEYNPRWQANYDIIYAQVLAYTARTFEYGAYLEKFKTNPKQVPFEKPKMLRLAEWNIRETSKIVAPEVSNSFIDRASAKFHEVIEKHPGTPWAARAEWELKRGFGVELVEEYHYYGPRPPRPNRPNPPRIPIPKL